MDRIELKESAFRQSFDGLAIGDKVYFSYRDETQERRCNINKSKEVD